MPGRDGLPHFVRQGVEHAVVGVDRGQTVLGQLILHDVDQSLHPGTVVCPVTHNLSTANQTSQPLHLTVPLESHIQPDSYSNTLG